MLIRYFLTFCGYLLDIHLLVVKVSVWGLNRITRYVLSCSNVHGIIAEIPCSIAHLKAHSTDLGLQIHKTCIHTLALGIGHTLVNTTKALNFCIEIQAWRKHFHVGLEKYNS